MGNWAFTGETLNNSAVWTWDVFKAPLASMATYTANTLVFGLNQVVALRDSLPALASPETKNIIKAVHYITVHQILPLVFLNYANNYLQTRANESESTSLICATTLIDWVVWAYTCRQGLELLVETSAINAYAPSAFNAYKTRLPERLPSPCLNPPPCNFKRRAKGSLREFFILSINDFLTAGINQIPYIGQPAATAFSTYCSGDLIVRSSLVDRCERHRSSGSSEVLLAVGATYTAANMLLDSMLQRTLGPLPFLVHRALRHLLFLAFVNNTAHMRIDYIEPGKGTLAFDPIVLFGRLNSKVIDIAFAGIMDALTKLFHPEPNAQPIISLSYVLKKLTKILNSDLEKINDPKPGLFKKSLKQALPPVLRSTKNAVEDPVIRIFWKDLQELLPNIMEIVENAAKPVGKLMKAPIPGITALVKAALPELLFQKYGLSKNLSKFLINLSRDDDFWSFFLTLKQWLDQHHIQERTELAILLPGRLDTLNEPRTTAPRKPTEDQITPVPSPTMAQAPSASITAVSCPQKPTNITVLDPSFFAQRQRRKAEQQASEATQTKGVMAQSYQG